MTYRVAAIQNAVIAVLEGRLGAVRTVPRGMYKFGTFDGNSPEANHALALDINYQHRFDVKIGTNKLHGSTPVSGLASYRNVLVPITIDITTRLASKPQASLRNEQRALIASDADVALQALAYRGNLTADEDGVPTSIISGLLQGESSAHPEWSVVEENWDGHVHKSRINAAAIVQIGQATL